MVGEKIRTMLVDEMKASSEFSRRNFGLAVGDGFREIVEETVQSSEVSAHLLLGMAMMAITGGSLGQSLTLVNPENKGAISKVILDNFEAFKTPMEFFYWGIQVGRKLAAQEAETLNRLEKQE